jgi:zinc/manganese transport system permease protein
LHGKGRLLAGYGVGGLSYIAGITLSAVLDLPTGAVVVWTMAVFAVIASYIIKHQARG